MVTVGEILKEARLKKKLSLSSLEKETKIKKEFIDLIENNLWDKLPDYPVVSGFVRNLAVFLEISAETTNAILRRDYLPKKLHINPNPDIESKFYWSPRLTFVTGISLLTLLVLGYLGFEYLKFVKPPELEIYNPKNNEVVFENKVKVTGKTTTDVILTVNNQPILLDQEGKFQTEIEITKDTSNLLFKAISRSGKITEKVRNISVE
ncbi:MAG: helix-turn-helix domain-containing protein [Candidatus Woesebacteria bacterium]|nr:helix-turn-helix domain-containing protein [Candidatus Woesebacteria bacterium]